MTVTVKQIGGSVAVVIPRAMARDMGLTEGTPLDITSGPDAIVMRRRSRRPRRAVGEIVSQIKTASYRRRSRGELRNDAPVGKEAW